MLNHLIWSLEEREDPSHRLGVTVGTVIILRRPDAVDGSIYRTAGQSLIHYQTPAAVSELNWTRLIRPGGWKAPVTFVFLNTEVSKLVRREQSRLAERSMAALNLQTSMKVREEVFVHFLCLGRFLLKKAVNLLNKAL